ncbi:MAG: copper resistance protein B [Gammaproteobacteria bacterium]|nr:copper resistance protein B [Gammaproteobacteria bacterium]
MVDKPVVNKLVSLFCLLVMYSGFAVSEEKQAYTDDESADVHNEWKFRLRLNKFERQFSTENDESYGEWAGFIMLGKELDKFWLTTKGSTQSGEVDSSETRLFYSRTIKPYIAVIAGWRRDIKPDPERDWLNIGLLGVLPGKVGADVSLFFGESGRQALRLEVAYKYWLTDKLSLTPDLEANFYSEDDPQRSIGSGLSDLDLGLRLRYHVFKGVLPYAGLTWKGNFGKTADIIESRGEDPGDLRLMLGITLQY